MNFRIYSILIAVNINVVRLATLVHGQLRVPEDCCIKYNNNPEKPLDPGEILHTVQQFLIWADFKPEMLYSVQDY